MSKQVRWLWKESAGWVKRGLISEAQASGIRALYPEPKEGLPWSTLIFSGLGGVIGGLGIILLVAYNWQELHRLAKLSILLVGIIGLHFTGLRLFLRDERWKQVGEALSTMGSMLFGAGIWLVAQAYHIQEHFPNGFLIWGIGALALAWAMPSIAQGLLAVVVLCIWNCSEAWSFNLAIHWGPALVLVSGGFLAWRARSLVLLSATLAGFLATLAANVGSIEGELVVPVLISCSASFVAVGLLAPATAFPESGSVWKFFGWTGFLVCLYLLTFPAISADLLGWRSHSSEPVSLTALAYEWTPLVAAVGLWAALAWRSRPQESLEEAPGIEDWLLPLTAILCQVVALLSFREADWLLAGVFNLVFLSIAGMWMSRGGRTGALQPMVVGSLMLVALATARFFDLLDSLALRGLVFLVVGGVLLFEGIMFRRARRAVQVKEAQ